MKSKWLIMKKSSFIEGTFIATFAIIFTKILGMLYVIPFYAMVGVQGSALYAYAYSIYNIFLDISSAGLPIAMSKIIGEYNTLGKMDAKIRAYYIGKRIMVFLAVGIFMFMMIFAKGIASVMLGSLEGGNTVSDVAFAIRCVSFAILIVPFLSVTKGYLQGHKIINISSFSQVIEQIVRILIILCGSALVLYVFGGKVTIAVGISLLGAFLGGVVAYTYIQYKMHKDTSKELSLNNTFTKDDISNKEIVKKIFTYAIPFIIINIVSSCYNFIDLTLLIRTLDYIDLDTSMVEFAASSVTTYAPKINMIVASIAMGMSTSLIPAMVSSYALNDWNAVNKQFNQALQLLLFISLPMTIGISLLSSSIWGIFYGYRIEGTYILALNVFTGLLINIFMTTSSALQGLNRFKIVYLCTISGFVTNALLDVPYILLFNKIGIPPYLGAVAASITGYLLSIIIALVCLKKECKLKYRETFNNVMKMLVPLSLMVLVVVLLKWLVPVNLYSRISCVIYTAIISIVGCLVYFGISLKMGLVKNLLGSRLNNRILKKLTLGKDK